MIIDDFLDYHPQTKFEAATQRKWLRIIDNCGNLELVYKDIWIPAPCLRIAGAG